MLESQIPKPTTLQLRKPDPRFSQERKYTALIERAVTNNLLKHGALRLFKLATAVYRRSGHYVNRHNYI